MPKSLGFETQGRELTSGQTDTCMSSYDANALKVEWSQRRKGVHA